MLAAGVAASADQAEPPVTEVGEGGYIEKMDPYLAVKLRFDSDARGFELKTSGVDYDIRPNASIASRIGVLYRFVSFYVGFFPDFMPGNNDDELKGSTEARSYELTLSFGHWVQDLSYARVEGFHLDNTSDYVPGWVEGEDPYIEFPELVYTEYHGVTGYKMNPRFSLKALSSQTERQLKSAGALMPALTYNYYTIDNQVELTGENSSQKSTNLELLLSLAYFYTLVLGRNFYFSGGLAPGAGIIFTDLLTRLPSGDYTNSYDNPIYRLEADAALGYNSRRVFAGAQVKAAWERYDQEGNSAVVTKSRLTYQIFAGYRFNAPGFLNRMADRAAGWVQRD
jgi:hypothetical protein